LLLVDIKNNFLLIPEILFDSGPGKSQPSKPSSSTLNSSVFIDDCSISSDDVAILCGTEPEALDSSAAHVCFGLCGRTGFYFFFG
jgi:hypothetical protein